MVTIVDADAVGDAGIDFLRPSRVSAAGPVDEQNFRCALGHDAALLPSRASNIPQTDGTVVQRGYSQQFFMFAFVSIWSVERKPSRFDHRLLAPLPVFRDLEPTRRGWPVPLYVFVVPRDFLSWEGRVPVRHVLHLPEPRRSQFRRVVIVESDTVLPAIIKTLPADGGVIAKPESAARGLRSATVSQHLVPRRFFEAVALPQIIVETQLLQSARGLQESCNWVGLEVCNSGNHNHQLLSKHRFVCVRGASTIHGGVRIGGPAGGVAPFETYISALGARSRRGADPSRRVRSLPSHGVVQPRPKQSRVGGLKLAGPEISVLRQDGFETTAGAPRRKWVAGGSELGSQNLSAARISGSLHRDGEECGTGWKRWMAWLELLTVDPSIAGVALAISSQVGLGPWWLRCGRPTLRWPVFIVPQNRDRMH